MPNPRVEIKITRRRAQDRSQTLLTPARACGDCALRKGPACADCIHQALRGFGLVHYTPVVRH